MNTRIRFIFLLLILPTFAAAQRKVEAEKVHATETLSIGKNAARHNFTGATDTIDAGSTHQQIPTAKSVWDLLSGLGGGGGSVETDATLSGDGSGGDPLSWNGAFVDGPLTGNGLNATPLDVLNLGITEQYIGAAAVTSSKIRDTTIVTQDIKDAAITAGKIAANAIDSSKVCAGCISITDLGQHGAASGQVLKWNGTQWAPAADASGSGGDDWGVQVVETDATLAGDGTVGTPLKVDTSLIATISDINAATSRAWAKGIIGTPIYLPALSDQMFHNATLMIKEDTLHRWYHAAGTYNTTEVGLYIKHNSTGTSQAPAIHIRHYGPGTGNTNQNAPMITMELDSFSAPQSVPFTMNMNYVDAASVAGDNTVFNMGLNINKQGSSYRAGEPSSVMQFESKYAAASGNDQEWWVGFNGADGSAIRPFYTTSNRADNTGSVASVSANTIYFSTGLPATNKGVWSTDELIVQNPSTNGHSNLRIQGSGTGSSILRMRRPGDGSVYNMLSVANGTTYAQLSDSYLDVKLGADVFSLDHSNFGNAIISARYNSGSPNDTLDFGHYPGFGENYASHSNYRFTLSDGAAIYFGVYGNTIGNYGALGQTNANDIFLHTGKAITTTEVALGVDRSTGNVGISKIISDIDSDAALQVGGKVQVDDFSGTGAQLVARTSTNTLSDLIVGVGLAISGDSLKSTVTGGVSDHGALTGLSDDDHTQYPLLAGRSGGQSLTGGTASGNNLTLASTSNSTKGALLLGIDGSKTVVGNSAYFRGDLVPSALSGNTDDYNPAGLDTASTLRISASAAYNLTGIQGGADGRILYVYNIGEYTITLKNNTTSTSAYRFLITGDVSLRPGDGITLQYDATASKWRSPGMTVRAGSQPPASETIQSSGFTAVLRTIHAVDCSGGTISVTPPSSPGIGDRFAISDAAAASSTNNITINFSGSSQKLYGTVQNYVININGGYAEFIYMGSTTGWIATK